MYAEINFIQPAGSFAEAVASLEIPLLAVGVEDEGSSTKNLDEIISGGWGNSQEDAIIIANPMADTDKIIEGPRIEALLISLRNRLEFAMPHSDKNYALLMQSMHEQQIVKAPNGRSYDKVTFELIITSQENFVEVEPFFTGAKPVDADAMQFLKTRILFIERQFWFDVSSFIEQNWLLTIQKEQADFAACSQADDEKNAN